MAYYRPRYARRPAQPREMTARYAGRCEGCGEDFPAGTRIVWHGAGVSYHAECAAHSDRLNRADTALARTVAAGLGEEYVDDDADYRRQRARDDADYAQGLADGARYSSDRKLYGEALAEQWAMDAEMAAYNRGDD